MRGLAPEPALGFIRIAVPVLPRIANFDDLDPLRAEPGVELVMVRPGRPLPRDAALVILPGSKATMADLEFLRREGWDIDILAHRRHGGQILGLCGGYQMLGRTIADPLGMEGRAATVRGFGLLDIDTVLGDEKRLRIDLGRRAGHRDAGQRLRNASRETTGPGLERPMLRLAGRGDGAVSADGLVAGCYLHGLFASDPFRRAFLNGLALARANSPTSIRSRPPSTRSPIISNSISIFPRCSPRRGRPVQVSRLKCAASQAPSTRPPSIRQASL